LQDCLKSTVKSVSVDGVILRLEDGKEAWLPSQEWSSDAQDWPAAVEAIEVGEELYVSPLPILHQSMRVVSRRQLTERMVDDSWLNKPRIMRVTELTRMLIRGSIGSVDVVAEQQPYLDYVSRKGLNHWAIDHAVIGRGDMVGGVVTGFSEEGLPILNAAEYLEQADQEFETKPAHVEGSTKGGVVVAPRSSVPAVTLRKEIIEQITPVLLVENELRCRESISAILHRENVVVKIAEDSVTAHDLLSSNSSFRLVIVDLNLDTSAHDQNGFGVISRLQDHSDCRILLMTGEDFNETKRGRWGHLKVNACLLKPFGAEELFQAIDEAVSLTRMSWLDLLGGPVRAESGTTPTEPITSHPGPVSVQEAVNRLVLVRPGSVIHLFELHPRSYRARSVVSVNGSRLDWIPFRGKIAKSPIKDTAFASSPVDEPCAPSDGLHFWTRQMMDYQSFYGVSVRVPGPHRHALVAFHSERNAFDERFKFAARVCAEQVGRALDREGLIRSRTQEGAFAAMGMTLESLAHELRNETTPMIQFSRIVGDYITNARFLDNAEISTAKVSAGHLQRSADVIHKTVKALLGVRAKRQLVDVWECLRIAARRCRQITNETLPHFGAIRIEFPPEQTPLGELLVRSTMAAITIVLFNLFLNAAQQIDQMASGGVRRGGRIWSSCELRSYEKSARVVLLRIHDTGPGIHADDWHRIFQPGYSTKPEGTGLGLHICRHLLADISDRGRRATLNVTRSVLLDGTTFTLALPLTSQ
jgi:signal transduction histidine kinase/CheY-like chemotaxis protein